MYTNQAGFSLRFISSSEKERERIDLDDTFSSDISFNLNTLSAFKDLQKCSSPASNRSTIKSSKKSKGNSVEYGNLKHD